MFAWTNVFAWAETKTNFVGWFFFCFVSVLFSFIPRLFLYSTFSATIPPSSRLDFLMEWVEAFPARCLIFFWVVYSGVI